ncbi:hypothetical protein QJS10_CPA07g00773 [Acorus calamus]|uniref:Uncharacterized protein n=1 Tax=Acorus calamus TaxID=4465 RepID=A0AAV9EG18_ACOCL|nr:hypothetical protein QJS10_CPA07g00773 [Acorus calamus]
MDLSDALAMVEKVVGDSTFVIRNTKGMDSKKKSLKKTESEVVGLDNSGFIEDRRDYDGHDLLSEDDKSQIKGPSSSPGQANDIAPPGQVGLSYRVQLKPHGSVKHDYVHRALPEGLESNHSPIPESSRIPTDEVCKPRVPKGLDCAFFLMKYAESFTRRLFNGFDFSQKDMKRIRGEISVEFIRVEKKDVIANILPQIAHPGRVHYTNAHECVQSSKPKLVAPPLSKLQANLTKLPRVFGQIVSEHGSLVTKMFYPGEKASQTSTKPFSLSNPESIVFWVRSYFPLTRLTRTHGPP